MGLSTVHYYMIIGTFILRSLIFFLSCRKSVEITTKSSNTKRVWINRVQLYYSSRRFVTGRRSVDQIFSKEWWQNIILHKRLLSIYWSFVIVDSKAVWEVVKTSRRMVIGSRKSCLWDRKARLRISSKASEKLWITVVECETGMGFHFIMEIEERSRWELEWEENGWCQKKQYRGN